MQTLFHLKILEMHIYKLEDYYFNRGSRFFCLTSSFFAHLMCFVLFLFNIPHRVKTAQLHMGLPIFAYLLLQM